MEPFFVTFALYDARIGRKISSDFHAQFNHSFVKDMCNPVGQCNYNAQSVYGEPERKKVNYSWIENPKKGIFQVKNLHTEIYLVARIERVLIGGIHKTAQPYTKKDDGSKVTDRNIKIGQIIM